MINTHSKTLLISLWSLLTLTYLLTRNHLPRPRSTVSTCDLRLIIVLLEVHQLTITHQVSLKRRLPLCSYRMPNFMLSYVLSSLLEIYMKKNCRKTLCFRCWRLAINSVTTERQKSKTAKHKQPVYRGATEPDIRTAQTN